MFWTGVPHPGVQGVFPGVQGIFPGARAALPGQFQADHLNQAVEMEKVKGQLATSSPSPDAT